MIFRKAEKHQAQIDSLIGVGTRVDGDITFDGGLRLDGHVKGSMRVTDNKTGTLIISEQGRVEGEVCVSHLVINGTVDGPVYATELLELQANARVTGDVHYNNLEMHMGAVVQGRLVHQSAGVSRPVGLLLASNSN